MSEVGEGEASSNARGTSSHHSKKSQKGRGGQQMKCLQGKYPLGSRFSM